MTQPCRKDSVLLSSRDLTGSSGEAHMKAGLWGLSTVNIELTSRCQKACVMCGRRKIDRDYPDIALNYGDMDFALVERLASQIPPNVVVQFHNNGEPLLYPRFGDAVRLFPHCIRAVNTNAILVVEKAKEIIGNLDTLTISVVEDDPGADEQYDLVRSFLTQKGDAPPAMVYRCLGDVDRKRWESLPGLVVTRILHSPLGSFRYSREPTRPEIGICLDLLHHMAIDRTGQVSICVRFDPRRLGVIGDANATPLADIWNGELRREWQRLHIEGHRHDVPLCASCEFWGVPRGQ
jgi:radical SAM protein with 4Fe4S-binding SPASM domain